MTTLHVPKVCDEAQCTRRPTQVRLSEDHSAILTARCDWHVVLVPEDVTP